MSTALFFSEESLEEEVFSLQDSPTSDLSSWPLTGYDDLDESENIIILKRLLFNIRNKVFQNQRDLHHIKRTWWRFLCLLHPEFLPWSPLPGDRVLLCDDYQEREEEKENLTSEKFNEEQEQRNCAKQEHKNNVEGHEHRTNL